MDSLAFHLSNNLPRATPEATHAMPRRQQWRRRGARTLWVVGVTINAGVVCHVSVNKGGQIVKYSSVSVHRF